MEQQMTEELTQIKRSIGETKKEVHEIKTNLGENIGSIRSEVTEIKNALLGTNFNDGNGLVRHVSDHEKRIKLLEESGITNRMYMGILRFIAGTVAAAVLTGIISLVFYMAQLKK